MLKVFIDGIVGLVKLLGTKPKISDVLSWAFMALPALIGQVIDFTKADAKTKADEFLAALDSYTGSEPGAVRVFPHLLPEREEEFWDHIAGAAKLIIYERLEVPGYHVPKVV